MNTTLTYTEQDLLRIAKRDNNKKRPYLLVNRLQAKHYPASPAEALQQFSQLAALLYQRHPEERLLLIGFAETATAIGAYVAAQSPRDLFYMQTTREPNPGAPCIFFSEAHSHATEQKLLTGELDRHISEADRVVFIEDEVTTGNTISHIIEAMREKYGSRLSFGVASLLNAMRDDVIRAFEEENISLTYLLRVSPDPLIPQLDRYRYEADLRRTVSGSTQAAAVPDSPSVFLNARIGAMIRQYEADTKLRVDALAARAQSYGLSGKRVLVLGIEEFVYPPLLLAARLQNEAGCAEVIFQASTRSPILPSGEPDYPFFNRYELRSIYDASRTTYLYNLCPYDHAFVLHDAPSPSAPGICDLVGALTVAECSHIHIL